GGPEAPSQIVTYVNIDRHQGIAWFAWSESERNKVLFGRVAHVGGRKEETTL
ncbi:hypothetical protein ASPCADRAFT_203456, partial [Aspergillus carbonarius ITEM 5010]